MSNRMAMMTSFYSVVIILYGSFFYTMAIILISYFEMLGQPFGQYALQFHFQMNSFHQIFGIRAKKNRINYNQR
ncbi:unnamed protein product [Paramecium octaurelia]|uniref:Uncharacterized protein n=1 Tax=Paramecium octaurelia TaxID=43137 RepID=A0A8S1VMB4_PAROT|nr:unnamed protein product [Paramecium octaurelia]